jgi:glycerophosphoryl diester phosphodiesterase
VEELKQFDCGKRFNKLFPYRRMVSSTIPLLKNVVSRIEKYLLWNNAKPIQYFFDIKTSPDTDRIYHPKPEEIIIRLTDILRTQNISRRCTITSSDIRPLQQMKRLSQKVNIALKVENPESVNDNISALGFKPDIYMLPYKDVDNALIHEVHSLGMKLIPYGANDILDMNEMIIMNADGLLTDFPDHALKLLNVSEKSIVSVSHF